jgi:hypothetical protein
VGLGSAIGSTRVEGGKVVIQRDPGEPQIEFVKGVNVERIKYDGTKLLMGPVGIDGEIYDNFGSPGAAGQQLQSSGPGLPFVWGAGSGVGLTAVVAGSNISVDNTNPIAPVVNVAISSTLDMSGQNIINGNDVTLKGTNPSINFQNVAGADRAFLDYVDSSDKVTLSGFNVVAEAVGAGRGHRMILDAAGAALTSSDADVTLQRSQTFVGIKTIMTVEDNGMIQFGAAGITTFPALNLQSGLAANEFMKLSYDSTLEKGKIETGENGQLLVTTGSSMVFQSGGAVNITSADATIISANDSTLTMTSGVIIDSVDNIQFIPNTGIVDINGASSIDADPTLFLTNSDTGVSAKIIYDGTEFLFKSPDVPLSIQYQESGVTKTQLTVSSAGNMSLASDESVDGPPKFQLFENSTGTSGYLEYSGSTANLGIVSQNISLGANAGSINITTNSADTSISMSVNSGNAGLTVSDIAGLNSIESSAAGATMTVGNAIDPLNNPSIIMSANGNANQLKVTENRTEIVGDTGSSIPLLRFVDSSTVVPPAELSLENDGINSGFAMRYFDSTGVPASVLRLQQDGIFIVGDALGSGYVPQFHFKDIGYNTSAILSLNGNNFQLNADVFTVASSNVRLASIPLATKSNILYYDSVTNIVSYGANVLPVFVTGPTSATAITLTAADNNKTYVFTTRPSAFQQFNAVGLPLGFSISVRNAAGTGGGDIDIRKDGGLSLGTLHPRTGAVNASTIPLEVNGTGLIGYF